MPYPTTSDPLPGDDQFGPETGSFPNDSPHVLGLIQGHCDRHVAIEMSLNQAQHMRRVIWKGARKLVTRLGAPTAAATGQSSTNHPKTRTQNCAGS